MHFARVASITHVNYNAVWVCIASDLKLVQLIIYLLPDMYLICIILKAQPKKIIEMCGPPVSYFSSVPPNHQPRVRFTVSPLVVYMNIEGA